MIVTRREMLGVMPAAMAGAWALAGQRLTAAQAGVAPARLGVQLYTVRDQLKTLDATLGAIKSAGFDEVETLRPIVHSPARSPARLVPATARSGLRSGGRTALVQPEHADDGPQRDLAEPADGGLAHGLLQPQDVRPPVGVQLCAGLDQGARDPA